MAPYENQLIGAFLFALGYEGGRRNAKPMPANLFQQTPLDRAFSDLVVGADRCLVLEFKRTSAELSSERGKWSESALVRFGRDLALLDISCRSHLVVYGQGAEEQVELRFCAYADILGLVEPQLDRGPAQVVISLLYGGRQKGINIGVPPADLSSYLSRLASLKNTDAGRATQGAWLVVACESGQFRCLVANSLEQLLELQRQSGHGRYPESGRTRERKREEPELGM